MDDDLDFEEGPSISWRDMLLCLSGILLAMIFVILVSTTFRKDETTHHYTDNAPGNISIEIQWAGTAGDDVDLWVKSPDDIPVGYSRKNGKTFDLLRDDLGLLILRPPENHMEIVYSRGRPPGEYVVNLQLYALHAQAQLPVTVVVMVRIKHDDQSEAVEVLHATRHLTAVGQEITVWRFTLDGDGNIVPGSVNDLYEELRNQ